MREKKPEKEDEPPAVWCAPADLVPWAKNPRKNDPAVQKVADAIRRFGFGAPIVARLQDKRVIAGHTRLKAAKLLGLKRVPVRFRDVTEREAELMALSDNKLGEIAEWDEEALSVQLRGMSFDEAASAGWDWKELGKLAGDSLNDAIGGGGDGKGLTYSVLIDCADEDEQTVLLERFEAEGIKCKPLVL